MIGEHFEVNSQSYGRGLEGLNAGKTSIGKIDGKTGRLWYRGYSIEDLAEKSNFEEVSYLILHGKLPTDRQCCTWEQELHGWRTPPREALSVLQWLPSDAHPLAKYRTMLSVAACHMPEGENTRVDAQWRRPSRVLSWSTALAAAAIRHMNGRPPLSPNHDLGFSDNFLYQALGRKPDKLESKAFETSLIVQAEHGLHAAALSALVVISTGADLGSAVLAGMGALSGKLHGGANQTAFEMFQSLTDADEAKEWTEQKLGEKYRFPGFGHRIYKTDDPRAKILEPYAEQLLKKSGKENLWAVYETVKHEVETRLGKRGIYANVDAVTGLIYHPLGLPTESFPIPFALAIQTGWMAHCLEYIPDGKMIEPGAVYIPKE